MHTCTSIFRPRWASTQPVSGLILSKRETNPDPCLSVQNLIGEPPPILAYCSFILGVLLLAIHGASLLMNRQKNNYKLMNIVMSNLLSHSFKCKEYIEILYKVNCNLIALYMSIQRTLFIIPVVYFIGLCKALLGLCTFWA